LNAVSLPPRQRAPKLEGLQAGEYIVVEPAAKPTGIKAADFKGFPLFMACIAFALDADNGGLDFIAELWVMFLGVFARGYKFSVLSHTFKVAVRPLSFMLEGSRKPQVFSLNQVFGHQPGKMFKRTVISALAVIGETAGG
jgi:hypothetical protein